MDLHVVEPDGTRIWYSQQGPTHTGGLLDRDDNVCGTTDYGPGGAENVYWPDATTPASGTYAVEVREYSRCGEPSAANWELQIRVDGTLVSSTSGSGDGGAPLAFALP